MLCRVWNKRKWEEVLLVLLVSPVTLTLDLHWSQFSNPNSEYYLMVFLGAFNKIIDSYEQALEV
jgi:hypothetical protein